jgi:HAD superfamily phosphoserine phosphatase-like hydrolase
MENKLKLIIADIDGTLLPGSMESTFFRYLRDEGHVSWSRVVINVIKIFLTGGWRGWYRLKVAYLKGLRVEDVERWAQACYETEIAPSLYRSMQQGLAMLRERGIEVVLLSGSLNILAKFVSEDWGTGEFKAAEPAIERGRYTGGLREPHPYGRRKVEFARRILERRRLEWGRIGALADHRSDKFLLLKVARAIVVNPRSELSQLCDERGWGRIYRLSDPQHVGGVIKAIFLGGDS